MKNHAKAQRNLGHEAVRLETVPGYIKEGDIQLYNRVIGKGIQNPQNRNRITQQFLDEHLFHYDVYHFYYCTSLFGDYSDLAILRRHGKVIVMQPGGSDIIDNVSTYNVYDYLNLRSCSKNPPKPPMRTPKQHKNLEIIDQYVHGYLIGTARIDFVPRITLMPKSKRQYMLSLDIENWNKRIQSVNLEDKDPNKIYILHAPTSRRTKGTDFVLTALNRLKDNGYPIEPIIIQKVHPSVIHTYFAKADIAIDQLLNGWYGSFACEMMALRIPVLCRIDPYLKTLQNIDPPLVQVTPDMIYDELVKLIENPSLREQIGQTEYEFTKEHHDYMKVGQDLIDLYDSLLHNRPVIQVPNPDFYQQEIQEIFPIPMDENFTYENVILKSRLNNFDCNRKMAQIYKQKECLHQSIPFLERCIELKPDFFEGLFELGMYHLDRFRYWKAIPYFRRCLQLKPDIAKSIYQLACQRASLERYHDAIVLLELLVEFDENNAQYLCRIGQIYYRVTDYEKAELAFQQSLQRNPEYPESKRLLDHLKQHVQKLNNKN